MHTFDSICSAMCEAQTDIIIIIIIIIIINCMTLFNRRNMYDFSHDDIPQIISPTPLGRCQQVQQLQTCRSPNCSEQNATKTVL